MPNSWASVSFPEHPVCWWRKAVGTIPRLAAVIVVLAFLLVPPWYFSEHQSAFTPAVQFLVSVIFFLLAFWIARLDQVKAAARHANDRWLPQAEGAVVHLITLKDNVARLASSTRASCKRAAASLPELDDDALRPVRVKFETECDATGARLDDIGRQLDDLMADWQRFIMANCDKTDCARIRRVVDARLATLRDTYESDRVV